MRKCVYYSSLAMLCLFFWGAKPPKGDEKSIIYIAAHRALAEKYAKPRGIPLSITLAVALKESQAGYSELAIEANNHFGIKARSKTWKGAIYHKHDDDVDHTGEIAPSAFRKYKSIEQSYADFARFLRFRTRYHPLFSIPLEDYQGWAIGLKKAGYATDPNYAQDLIQIIERFKLHQLDAPAEATGRFSTAKKDKSMSEYKLLIPYQEKLPAKTSTIKPSSALAKKKKSNSKIAKKALKNASKGKKLK